MTLRIDNLPENDFIKRLQGIDATLTELKNQQTIGKKSVVPYRVYNNVQYDQRLVTGAVAVRQVRIDFLPNKLFNQGGLAYNCGYKIVNQTNNISSMEYRLDRQIIDPVTSLQSWIFTAVNDSGSFQPNTIDVKFFISGSGNGTLTTTVIT